MKSESIEYRIGYLFPHYNIRNIVIPAYNTDIVKIKRIELIRLRKGHQDMYINMIKEFNLKLYNISISK